MSPPPESRPPTSAPDPGAGSRLDLRDLVHALRRRWRLFAGIVLATVAGVMALTFLITPVWESEASLRSRSEDGGGLGAGLGAAVGGLQDAIPTGALSLPELGGTDVQTQIGVIRSRRIVEPVLDSLALHVSLARPWRAYRTDVLRVLEAGEDAPEGVFTLELDDGGGYAVSASDTEEPVELPDRVEIGRPFRIGPMRFQLVDSLAADPPGTVRFEVGPFREMVQGFREDLRVERPESSSRLIEIGYRHPDPELARAVVNGILDRFMEYSETTNRSDAVRRAAILDEEVGDFAARLDDAERRLEAFQERERVVAPEEQAVQQVERIAELQVEHDAMEVEREALGELLRAVQARAARAEAGEGGGSGVGGGGGGGEASAPGAILSADDSVTAVYRQLATYPSFITNSAVQALLETLTELENERAELLVRRTRENRDVRMLEGRIREIERQLHSIATDYVEGLDSQLASTSAALDRFGDQLEEIPRVEIEYARLRRERELLGQVYVVLRARLAETRVQERIDDARARVVDRAVIQDRPAFPRPEISLALSGALGIMLALFGVVVVETTSPAVRTRRDAEEAADAVLLAAVPDFAGAAGGRGSGPVLLRDPWHPASEAIRGLALTLLADEPRPRSVLVAGPDAGAGRSALAASLAVALARQGLDTALVDADLRDGDLHRLFGAAAEPGWLGAAVGGADLDDVERAVELDGASGTLHLLPRGAASLGVRGGHPLEALASGKVRALLERLEERHDVVVLDTPALEAGHDAAVLAPAADAVLLVARSGSTRRESLADAAERLRRSRAPVRGVVLNGVEEGRRG